MKKKGLLLGFMLLACAAFAQQSNTPYEFPVKPGSTQWQSFKTVEDMYAACQIPPNVLTRLSTTALIQTCLQYPAWTTLLIHTTPQLGFEEWKRNFNGIVELMKRRDAPARMVEYYKSVDIKGHTRLKTDLEKGDYTFLIMRVDAMIVQDEIIGNMNSALKRQLLNRSLANYNAVTADELYGFANHASTGRIIVKLADALGDNATRSMIHSRQMQEFVTTGNLADREAFLQIIAKAKSISTK
jgi:hypothetical protein